MKRKGMIHFIKSEARIFHLTCMDRYGTKGTMRGYIAQFVRDLFRLAIRRKS